ncbi:hypothetical protein CVT25_007460 [Psilocybe cyanescens]|uniref:Piwi domain-containing protein n=1 Tax=Psilocybe cyanescens TaxID=93625 RepID=A0A409XVH1_PSICY|nr:hypothetical protein CVT25_007460 [Psilocybe cyanescens]
MPPRIAPGRGRGAQRGGGPVRGGAAGRGGAVAIAAHVQTIGVRRPGFGTGGKVVNTIVNAFAVDIPDNIIHHYDIVSPDKLPARVNMMLFERLQTHTAPQVFSSPAVYDGRKNAYTMDPLPLGPNDSASFDVTLPREGPPPKDGNEKPPKVYKIKVTKVASINTEILHQFIAGTHAYDSAVSTSLTALNVAIRMQPNLKYPFNTRSFFTDAGKQAIGKGIELWRGYFQSLRPSQNKMYINLDISTGLMYRAGPLITLCLEYLEKRDPKELSPRSLGDRSRIVLQRFVSNMRVSTRHTGRVQPRVIKRLTNQSASQITFQTREGQTISVANYFRTVLGRPLQFPDNICVEIGSGACIPIELCDVPAGQIMRKQIPDSKTSDIVEFSKLAPSQRLASIRQGLNVLQYGQSEYVRKFGMNVAPTPMTVKARVLPTPVLRYGDASREKTIKPANGQWNMRDKIFFRPSVVKKWIIVVFDPRWTNADARELAESFCEGAASVGVKVEDPRPMIFMHNPQSDTGAVLSAAGMACLNEKKELPSLVVVVLPEGGNEIYTRVKYFGDVKAGVATQCLKSSKCRRAKLQYWANVMLKVNVKLGGINNVLTDNTLLNDPHNPTIVMGADVIHPAPGAEGRPSFTSLVSSVDQTTAKYVTVSKVQTGRKEIIEDLEEMVKTALTKYNGYRGVFEKGRPPCARLIFYRDGVSEGQFQQVLDGELPMIKKACKDMNVNPKITLIIVGKRHHIRMFPQQAQDADRSGNCQAGTTIDEGLGHPTEFDYYQLTHGGLLGTSRPAHYSVIYDDSNFNADAMQNLSFALCHVYARATRSVSIPAPVYYADIVCSRAKNHYAPGTNLEGSDSATQTSAQQDVKLETFKRLYQPTHQKMSNLMYFMIGYLRA